VTWSLVFLIHYSLYLTDQEINVMDLSDKPSETDRPARPSHLNQSDLKIALQSALAAGLCLGLPAGIIFWLIILQSRASSTSMNSLVNFFRDNLVPPVLLEMLGAIAFGCLLSKISGYRQWWWLSAATVAGVRVGDFALYNGFLDQWVQGHTPSNLPLQMRFGLILLITVLCVTVSTGLLLGFTLLNWRASLRLAASTGLAALLAASTALLILDRIGIRVGSGNMAMPKVAATGTLAAALAGGAMLGVVFTHYVRGRFPKHQAG
jgi:hypothetical protein